MGGPSYSLDGGKRRRWFQIDPILVNPSDEAAAWFEGLAATAGLLFPPSVALRFIGSMALRIRQICIAARDGGAEEFEGPPCDISLLLFLGPFCGDFLKSIVNALAEFVRVIARHRACVKGKL